MNHAQGLIEEAAKHEAIAAKLREAAAIIGGNGNSSPAKKKGKMSDLIKILKKSKTIRVSQITHKLGIAKPTVYTWLKKKDIFSNNAGEVSLKKNAA